MMDSVIDKIFRFWRTQKVINLIPKESVICDIGCGKDAYLLNKIKHTIKKAVALDQDLSNHIEGNIEFKNVKIVSELPLPNNSFDAVTMVAILEHLEKPENILAEIFRILKDDGNILLTTPSPISRPILNFLAFFWLIDRREIRDHKNYFWPGDIKRMLCRSGFKDIKIKAKFFELFTNILIVAKK